MPSHDRIGQQLFLEGDAKLKWQIHVQDRNVERRSVIHRIDMRLRSVDLVEAGDFTGEKIVFMISLRPERAKPVQEACPRFEEPERDGKDSQDQRVEPDQRIEDEIGTQTAEPAVVPGIGSARVRLDAELAP